MTKEEQLKKLSSLDYSEEDKRLARTAIEAMGDRYFNRLESYLKNNPRMSGIGVLGFVLIIISKIEEFKNISAGNGEVIPFERNEYQKFKEGMLSQLKNDRSILKKKIKFQGDIIESVMGKLSLNVGRVYGKSTRQATTTQLNNSLEQYFSELEYELRCVEFEISVIDSLVNPKQAFVDHVLKVLHGIGIKRQNPSNQSSNKRRPIALFLEALIGNCDKELRLAYDNSSRSNFSDECDLVRWLCEEDEDV